ncbi:GntR family transcriptional regulator [Alicyclobacillus hesperidum]|uniref:DNA-binding transcriptional regulator, GntR family n=1 Tax=Alicyclobacillus hesperidum TaxID=89784 RepID=A0A1H2X968_9BACL|nr:GntR family transcriptional regulator [Alicyclobacillus hesperidum]GLV14224.1 GntR family transcriptional regulator [Alicyclobacillus hesperidum]SDW89472.1 DNA-binding transcriptional regulator, GntR family [Alicyclobacillus hesperidum]
MSTMRDRKQTNPASDDPNVAQTKTDVAVQQIRHRILTGVYKAGMRLRQSELVQDLGLGITPVREAFMLLISEGLLIRRPYAGVIVAQISTGSVEEVYAIRKVLERYAIEQACAVLTPEHFTSIDRSMQNMHHAITSRDPHAYQEANHAFHMEIYTAAGNPRLTELIETHWRMFPRGVFGLSVDRMKTSMEEHQRIVEALVRRDALLAGSYMVTHIDNYERHVIQLMKDNRSI